MPSFDRMGNSKQSRGSQKQQKLILSPFVYIDHGARKSTRDRLRRSVQAKIRREAFCRGSNDFFKDATKVVHRRKGDWSRTQEYRNCIFLDEYDTVLACDTCGAIDIIRLPPFEKSNEPRKLGTTLVKDFKLPSSGPLPTPLKFKSIESGKAFVVGTSKSFSVIASERIDKGSRKLKLQELDSSPRSKHKLWAWTIEDSPSRTSQRFRRDVHVSPMTIPAYDVARTGDYERVHDTPIPYAYDPQTSQSHEFSTGIYNTDRSLHWDFLETSSSLLAVSAESKLDSFLLTLFDYRVNKPVISFAQKSGKVRSDEITDCAFASEKCLLTSHVQSPSGGVSCSMERPFCKAGLESLVNLWDIRMMYRKSDAVATALPQHRSTPALKPTGEAFDQLKMSDANAANDLVVTNLRSSCNQGTVLITSKSITQQRVYHDLLNLGRMETERSYVQKGIDETSTNSLHAVAGSHSTLAYAEDSDIVLHEMHDLPVEVAQSKRRRDGSRKTNYLSGREKFSFRMTPSLRDAAGLSTQISCMSMNHSGNSLLCGSMDGDLFLWRGV